jgi:NADH-quinone oxidoreductase subunit J
MVTAFFVASAIAILATILVITHTNAVHALLYLVLSLLSIAIVFYLLGAPFIAALEIIIYAGAIMVLFVFVVMMLNIGPLAKAEESKLLKPRNWIGPSILSILLAVELVYIMGRKGVPLSGPVYISPKEVARSLFEAYLIAVELASILLMSSLVGAYHIGRRWKEKRQ